MKITEINPGMVFPYKGKWRYHFTVSCGEGITQVVKPPIDFDTASMAKQAMREKVRRERIRNGLM